MMRSMAVAAVLVREGAGHGQLTYPTSRSGSDLKDAGGCPSLGSSNGHDHCAWNIDGVTHPGPETLPDYMITTDALKGGQDFSKKNPWRAPGTTPLPYPCGKLAGKDGREFPPTARTIVKAGGVLEIAWAINANHGGGTSIRLCPSKSDLSEGCFQQTVLRATSNHSWIQWGDNKESRKEIPMLRTTEGTFPAGSEWTRNPIPDREDYFPNPLGLHGHGPFVWNIVDEYRLPANIASGDYVLSWRWDCEETEQVWANCADITVSGTAPPGPAPPAPSPTPPSPTPAPSTCNIYRGQNNDGSNMKKLDNIASSEACCDSCSGEKGCVGFTYVPGWNTCYLKDSVGKLRNDDTVTSGTVGGIAPQPTPAPAPVVPAACDVPDHFRKDCGHSGTKQPDCEAAGCCWVAGEDGSKTPWCFHKESETASNKPFFLV